MTSIFSQSRIRKLAIVGIIIFVILLASFMQNTTSAYAAPIPVTNATDELTTNGLCSLREAISNANNDAATYPDCPAGSGVDTITLPAGTYTLSIGGTGEDANATGDLDITSSMNIVGASAGTTIIDGAAIDRVLHIDPAGAGGLTVDLFDLTINNGKVIQASGGGIYNNGAVLTVTDSVISNNNTTYPVYNGNPALGGGIYNTNNAEVNVIRSTFSGNTAEHDGGGLYTDANSSLLVTDSTFDNNTATSPHNPPYELGDGGGIAVTSTGLVTITGSTFSNNIAKDDGGGLAKGSLSLLTITNSTFSGNSAGDMGGGIYNAGAGTINATGLTITDNTGANGAGILNALVATANFDSVIIANSTGADCVNLAGTLNLTNVLIEDNTCTPTLSGDPNLGGLQDNGGPTWTHALLAGSVAIDAGGVCELATDERGAPRDSTCDIGAFEAVFFIVTTTDELTTNGLCSLREAISNANNDAATYPDCPAGSGVDTITLPAGTYTLSIGGTGEDANATGDLDITSSMNIVGAGAGTTTIDGAAIDRVLHIDPAGAGGLTVNLFDLTINNGRVVQASGGGIYNNGAVLTVTDSVISNNNTTYPVYNGNPALGGGIYNTNNAAVNIIRSTFSGNRAEHDGGGLYTDANSSLLVTDSTFDNNTATSPHNPPYELGDGGGIAVTSTGLVTITGSTFSNNTAKDDGGGLAKGSLSLLTITNSTFSGNSAGDMGGGIYNAGAGTINATGLTITDNTGGNGAGILNALVATGNFNSVIIANSTGADCVNLGGTLNLTNVLIEDNTCTPTLSGDPNLGGLQDNGGPTWTHALLVGSVAIDAGGVCGLATDERGAPRDSTCDIGAYEAVFFIVTTTDELTTNGLCSLREAISNANNDAATYPDCPAGSGVDTITLPAGTYTLSIGGTGEDANATGDLDITSSMNIVGAGAGATIIDANSIDRVFHVTGAYTVSISDVTVKKGTSGLNHGGGIHNNGGTLTVSNSTFSGNSTSGSGGGIYSKIGALTVINSTFGGNSATDYSGGGIYNGYGSILAVSNSTFSGNSATSGGGIYNTVSSPMTLTNSTISANTASLEGGGIHNNTSLVTITNSTLSDNSAPSGGGLFNVSSGTVTVTNSTFSGNSATSGDGGGINNTNLGDNTVTVNNSTFSGNSATNNGGGIRNYVGTVTMTNSFIANSTSGGNCSGTILTGSGNLDDDNSCAGGAWSSITPGTDYNITLADNGCTTSLPDGTCVKTHALLTGSMAINATGTCPAMVSGVDQRGYSRDFSCDVGAYEDATLPPDGDPSNLTATLNGQTQVDLSWTDNSTNEAGFKVERSPSGADTWSVVTITAANVESYSDMSVLPGGWDYQVRAVTAGGDSNPTNIDSATTTFNCSAVADIPQVECDALVALYNNTGGASWTDNTDWMATYTSCSWYGVTCSGGNVTKIILQTNNLDGTLPDLSALTSLQELDLFDNSLTGSIPDFSALTSLQILYLSYNQLSSSFPAASALPANLVNLYLHENQLTGNVPDYSPLTSLEIIFLGANPLSGGIPAASALPASLTHLYLGNSPLSGSIPDLSTLTNLQQLLIYNTQLNGSIPDLSANTSLTTVILFNNQLTGSIPDLSALTSLIELQLQGNHLIGSIPDLSAITTLTYLNLSNNQLSGDVPASIAANLSSTDIGYNKLTDPGGTAWDTEDPDWKTTQTIAITSLSVTGTTRTTATLSWTAIPYTGDGGHYKVYYATSSGGPYTLAGNTADKTATGYTVSGLTDNTTYYFIVRSYTPAHGDQQNALTSEDSAEVTDTTVANVAPTATLDEPTTNEDAAKNVMVLGNDTDSDGDALSLTSITQPSNGSAAINDNGTSGDDTDDYVVYTPDQDYSGADSFTYDISDGFGGTDTGTVNVTVDPVNDVPNTPNTPSPTDSATGLSIYTVVGWTGGDVDTPYGDTVTYDVYLDTNATPTTLICDNTTSTSCDPGTLQENTTYYWYVVASDSVAASTTGATWSFTTTNFCGGQSEIPASECTALLTFYTATNGASWMTNTDWFTTATPCTSPWYGLTCGGGKVTGLALPDNALSDSAVDLSALTTLASLDLSGNSFSSFPVLPTSLTDLNLSGNLFIGAFPDLSALTALTTLNLSNNGYTGDVPSYTLPGGLSADIGYNALTDPSGTDWDAADPNWKDTQTIAPASLNVDSTTSSSITLIWSAIPYAGDGGYYEVSYAYNSGGPWTVAGLTADKTATGYVVNGLPIETSIYFRVRTYTPAHGNQQNDLWSVFTSTLTAKTSPILIYGDVDDIAPIFREVSPGNYEVTVVITGVYPYSCGGRAVVEQDIDTPGKIVTITFAKKLNLNRACSATSEPFSLTIVLTGTYASGEVWDLYINGTHYLLDLSAM